MKKLIANEWKLLWKRKVVWLIFFSIPIMVYAAAKFTLYQNTTTDPSKAHYAVAGNFPLLGLSEMLMTAFNFIVLAVVTMVVTEEYRSGQLRLILIRTYSFRQLIFSKYFAVMGLMFVYLFSYFVICYFMGYGLFPKSASYPQFYEEGHITNLEGLIYNLKFYGLAYLTMLAMGTIIFYIAIVSKTTTTAIGIGIGFLLFSFMYPNILYIFGQAMSNELLMKLFFTSIPMIQWQGLTLMLAKTNNLFTWNVVILCGYILLFHTFILLNTKLNKDIFI